jgi:hypothetical protein
MQGYVPEERISESHGRVNVRLSAYHVINKNETTARMVLVVYKGVTWLIAFVGEGGQSHPRLLGTSIYEEVK